MSDFKRLKVWRKSHALALSAHRVANGMRGSVHMSLRNQLIRAAMSIPTNIVEGRGQKSELEFCRFLRYSLNSAAELEYHLILAHDVGAISETDFLSLRTQAVEVQKMLHGLLARLSNTRPGTPTKTDPS
jgi:four helix bundle protein